MDLFLNLVEDFGEDFVMDAPLAQFVSDLAGAPFFSGEDSALDVGEALIVEIICLLTFVEDFLDEVFGELPSAQFLGELLASVVAARQEAVSGGLHGGLIGCVILGHRLLLVGLKCRHGRGCLVPWRLWIAEEAANRYAAAEEGAKNLRRLILSGRQSP